MECGHTIPGTRPLTRPGAEGDWAVAILLFASTRSHDGARQASTAMAGRFADGAGLPPGLRRLDWFSVTPATPAIDDASSSRCGSRRILRVTDDCVARIRTWRCIVAPLVTIP